MDANENLPRIVFARPAYTVAEFAKAVGLGETTIREHIDRHELIVRYPTKTKSIVTAEDGYDWLRRLPTEGAPRRRFGPGDAHH